MRIARVLPDVTGLDKSFDYLIPDSLVDAVGVGTIVRVDLHNRRIGGWVTQISDRPADDIAVSDLKAIAKVTGHGPRADLIELAQWASVRWAARRTRPFMVTASPVRAVRSLPGSTVTSANVGPRSPATSKLLAAGGGVLRLPPRVDIMPAILSSTSLGPCLVVVPEQGSAAMLATRLRRAGLTVALMPNDWAAAAAGVDVVIGNRSAAWAPCAGMASAIVIDEHDEALQEQRAPTWHARDVVVERCRRVVVPFLLTSPAPSLDAVEQYAGTAGVVHPPRARERAGWPAVVVVDRSDEEPWKRSLVTSPLIERIRNPNLTVVCVSNITGRARVLACRSCHSLLRCERCDAAVALDAENRLDCRRCGLRRPPVCQHCGASSFANLRPGVTRLREELEGAAARPVVAVTGTDEGVPIGANVYVGTEAVLHRVASADVVAFLEFDSEMLAPRFRASEQSLALIIRAGRLAPEVLIQTFSPDHDVISAAAAGDPEIVLGAERERRKLLSLPPYGALAVLSGSGSNEIADQLDLAGLEVGGDGEDRFLVRAESWEMLGRSINATQRTPRSRVRIEVDPARV